METQTSQFTKDIVIACQYIGSTGLFIIINSRASALNRFYKRYITLVSKNIGLSFYIK